MGLLKLFAKLFPGQRVDQPDLQFAARDSQIELARQLVNALCVDGGARIVTGFGLSVAAGVLTVAGGRALLAVRREGAARFGVVVVDDEEQTWDLTGLSGTQNVYVSARLTEQDFKSRVFWDEPAGTEYLRGVPTREAVRWVLRVATTSPGGEWALLGTLDLSTDPVGVADKRRFLFDARPENSGVLTNDDWGGGSDRTSYGLDAGRWALGLMRAVQDIIGASPLSWKAAIPRSLTALNANKLERDGSQNFAGDLLPDADGTFDLGSAIRRWQEIYVELTRSAQIVLGEALLGSDNDAIIPRVFAPFSSASGRRTQIHFSLSTDGTHGAYRVYRASGGLMGSGLPVVQHVYNATWVPGSPGSWAVHDAGGGQAMLVEESVLGVVAFAHLLADGETWADAIDAPNWRRVYELSSLAGVGSIVATESIATTDFHFLSPRTFVRAFNPANAIISPTGSPPWSVNIDLGSGPVGLHKASGVAGTAAWVLDLPHGAVLSEAVINLSTFMNGVTPQGGATPSGAYASFVRQPKGGGNPSLIGAVPLPDGGAWPNNTWSDVTVPAGGLTVDNNADTYLLRVYSDADVLWTIDYIRLSFVLDKIVLH